MPLKPLKPFQEMRSIEDLPHQKLLDLNDFFARVNARGRTKTLGSNSPGTQESGTDVKAFEWVLASQKVVLQKGRYGVNLTLSEPQREYCIQENEHELDVVVKRSWKIWPFYQAIYRRCRNKIHLKFWRRDSDFVLPGVVVENRLSPYPFLMLETVNLMLHVDASAEPRFTRNGSPRTEEQVDALFHAIEKQVKCMPKVERLEVQLRCGPIDSELLFLELKYKVYKRLSRRGIQVEVHRVF